MKKIGHASASGAVTEISTLNWNVWMLMLCLKAVLAVFEKSGRVRKAFLVVMIGKQILSVK